MRDSCENRNPESLSSRTEQESKDTGSSIKNVEDDSLDRGLLLLRSEVKPDRQFSINGIVPVHLGIERPLFERLYSGQIDEAIFRGHQNHERGLRGLADENAGFHPLIDCLSL